ncbi:MAG TPA: aminotransferase class V-fold PLP-dependent enzyme, partial [Acidobacteriota bacterium]|nr:aminotransferase class V-fold PLP-dependent enzyme [Acidobacteriota bacterium]
TSYGLNMVLWGLGLRRGERILIPEVEFPAVVYAVRHLADVCGLRMESLPCPDGWLDEGTLKRALRRKAAVLAISWVQYFNGYRYDLKALADICHAHGCFLLVDAIQGAGAVPMRMRTWGVDAVASGTQKWLLGEAGAGFFAVAESPIRTVRPPFTGWLSRDWRYRFTDLQRWDRPEYTDGRRWEIGSYPQHAVRLAHAGLSLLNECGIGEVFRRIQHLAARLTDGLDGCRHRVVHFPARANRSGIIIIRGPETEALFAHLRQRGFHLAFREGNIRVAPHFYNTVDEIDALIGEVEIFERKAPDRRTTGRRRTR